MNAEQDKVQWIYGQLCDEESRYLFENRRKYAESGEWKYIENIVRSIPQSVSYTHLTLPTICSV